MSDELIPIPEGWLDPQFKGVGGVHVHWPEDPPEPQAQPKALLAPMKNMVVGAFGAAVKPGRVVANPIALPPITKTGVSATGSERNGARRRMAREGGPGSAGVGGVTRAGDTWVRLLNTSGSAAVSLDPALLNLDMAFEWPEEEEPGLPTPEESEDDLHVDPLFPPVGMKTLPAPSLPGETPPPEELGERQRITVQQATSVSYGFSMILGNHPVVMEFNKSAARRIIDMLEEEESSKVVGGIGAVGLVASWLGKHLGKSGVAALVRGGWTVTVAAVVLVALIENFKWAEQCNGVQMVLVADMWPALPPIVYFKPKPVE